MPSLSLIISFYNKTDLLQLVFEALKRQTFKEFEVIIADDGSNEESVKCIQELISQSPFPVKHCWHEDSGWRKNIILNRALQASEADYIVFMDGDCIPHKRFLEEHYMGQRPKTVLCGRRVQLSKSMSEKLTCSQIRKGYLEGAGSFVLFFLGLFGKSNDWENALRIPNKKLRKWFIKEKKRGILGCNFSIHKSDLMKVNGFDERFLHPGTGEDTDLDHRLQRAGIFGKSKKHSITLFHIHHRKFDLKHTPNIELLRENDEKKITFTPYGLIK